MSECVSVDKTRQDKTVLADRKEQQARQVKTRRIETRRDETDEAGQGNARRGKKEQLKHHYHNRDNRRERHQKTKGSASGTP